jgi:hypothetical protein
VDERLIQLPLILWTTAWTDDRVFAQNASALDRLSEVAMNARHLRFPLAWNTILRRLKSDRAWSRSVLESWIALSSNITMLFATLPDPPNLSAPTTPYFNHSWQNFRRLQKAWQSFNSTLPSGSATNANAPVPHALNVNYLTFNLVLFAVWTLIGLGVFLYHY